MHILKTIILLKHLEKKANLAHRSTATKKRTGNILEPKTLKWTCLTDPMCFVVQTPGPWERGVQSLEDPQHLLPSRNIQNWQPSVLLRGSQVSPRIKFCWIFTSFSLFSAVKDPHGTSVVLCFKFNTREYYQCLSGPIHQCRCHCVILKTTFYFVLFQKP